MRNVSAPSSHLAIHSNVSPTLFHEAVDHGQPETGPFPRLFGRKERLENMRQSVSRFDAGSGVCYRQHDVLSGQCSGVGSLNASVKSAFAVSTVIVPRAA